MASVIIENVSKIYRDDKGNEKLAVDQADFEIKDKEFVVLVGPSGCGKTTTLRMVAGLEDITQGKIYIDGKVINDVPPKDRDIAMVFQNYALYPHMSVYRNMAFGLELRKVAKEEIDRRVMSAAKVLGLLEPDNLLQRKPKALSGGQRQRVALGRCIVRQPKAFLFDEPLSNLDAKMRVETRTEISKLHRRLDATMIYVTHDQVEAMTMADRIVVMNGGKIQQIADPLTIYNEPANQFVAGFIGSPPMNFVRGRLVGEGGKLVFVEHGAEGHPGFRLALAEGTPTALQGYLERDVVLGIRPEHIHNAAEGAAAPGRGFLRAKVEVVEPMGAETMVYLRTAGHELISRSNRNLCKTEIGHEAEFGLDLERVRFFDPLTQNRVGG